MEINIEDLTTMDLQGDGAFDNIMTAMQTRLDREFKKNRLKGPEYAKVYLGSYEASLMNTVQFLLGRQEASAKADLLKEQTKTEIEQRKLVQAQIKKMEAEERLIEGQIDKMEQEILVMKGQVSKIPHEIDLLKAQVIKMQKDGELVDGQIKKMEQEILLMKGQVEKMKYEIELMQSQVKKTDAEIKLIDSQIDKMKYEIDVMEQQVLESIQKVETMKASVWAERAKTESSCKIYNEPYEPECVKDPITGKLFPVGGLVGAQIRKSDEEAGLIRQKELTEQAQILDMVTNSTHSYDVSGVLGKQKALYQKQTDGFDRDAEQKLSKILVDTWNVRRTTDDQTTAGGTGLEDLQINNVLNIAKDGINAPRNIGGSFIPGVSVHIFAWDDIIEGAWLPFTGVVIIEDNPSLSVNSWRWVVPEGNPSSQYRAESDPNHRSFWTSFSKGGVVSVSLEIVIFDTGSTPENHGKTLIATQSFYVVGTEGGAATLTQDKAKAAKWHADNPDKFQAKTDPDGVIHVTTPALPAHPVP